MTKRLVNLLPFCGIALAIGVWSIASRLVSDLPSPVRTWEEQAVHPRAAHQAR